MAEWLKVYLLQSWRLFIMDMPLQCPFLFPSPIQPGGDGGGVKACASNILFAF